VYLAVVKVPGNSKDRAEGLAADFTEALNGADGGTTGDLRSSLTGNVDPMSAGTVSRRLERGKEVTDPDTVVAVLRDECQLQPRRAAVVQSNEVADVQGCGSSR
jgi:hypothetical protein